MGRLIVGLILAALAGLSFLAYHEPLAYRKIHNVMWPALSVLFVLFFVYEMGVTNGQSRVWPYVAPDKFEAAWGARATPDQFFLFCSGWVGLSLYLAFLRYLGQLTGKVPAEPESGVFIGWRTVVKDNDENLNTETSVSEATERHLTAPVELELVQPEKKKKKKVDGAAPPDAPPKK